MAKQYVIIGASAAALGAILKLLQLDPTAIITCISRETEMPYNKCFLADYVARAKSEQLLSIIRPDILERITLLQGFTVESIDRIQKCIRGVLKHKEQSIAYDTLLLATGSSPFIPSFNPMPQYGFFTFHTLADAQAILAYAHKYSVKEVVIIGAGLSGLECADALQSHGLQVVIIERYSHVLPTVLSASAAEYIHHAMYNRGILLCTNTCVDKIITVNNGISGVDTGEKFISAQMVICATGLRPNTELAKNAGIVLDGAGVQVNEFLQTNDEHIYAAGDVITVTDTISGKRMPSCLWPDAMQQGMVAAQNMCGKKVPYKGAAIITSTAFFGLKCAVAGEKQSQEWLIDSSAKYYQATIMRNGLLAGFVLIGEDIPFGHYRRALLTKQLL
jgi:NAD(P)H-nitrite reductase large subunit